MSATSDNRSLLTEGIFLAVVSAYIYLITFIYEYGFCSHFGIPASLITPNVSTFLVAAVALVVTLLPTLNLLPFTTPLFKASRDPSRRAFREVYLYVAISLVIGIFLAVIYGVSFAGVAWYIATTIALLALLFLPGLLSNRHLPISERLSIHADIQEKDPFVITNLFEGWISYRHMRIGALAFIMLGVAYLVGDAEARRKELFFALKSEQSIVLLRNYGDLLILGKVDMTNHIQGLRLMWLSEKKELDIVSRKIGPITTTPSQSTRQSETNLEFQNGSAGTSSTAAPKPSSNHFF